MNDSEFETCEQCGTRVRVERTVEVFGEGVLPGTGPVFVDVLTCEHGHRFPDPRDDGLTPDRA